MECKCCGEKAEFKLSEEGFLKTRYQCSNCNKFFKTDKKWLQGIKTVRNVAGVAGWLIFGVEVTYHVATGNPEKAVKTLAKRFNLDGNDNDSTIA
jgi:hypothetical protein